MKSTNISYNGEQSCSCTSCTYKSEADHPALRRIISQGTRIDRLYYGKYIPLRERKLLEKLVRTRGVYDDIRAQLISNSTISLEKKAKLKHHMNVSPKKLKATHHNTIFTPQYSSEIFKLVDLVDKGKKMESKELSGCCSCCTCSSKYDDHYKHIDKHRLKRANPGALRHRYNNHKIGDYRKRGVRFETKHIKSDPCTCTFKFSGMLKHLSKGTPKKILGYHDEPFADLKLTFDEEINQRPNKGHFSYLSNENLQQSKTHLKEIMLEGIRKLSEKKLRIQEKIELHEKKSLEKLSKLKSNIKSKVKTFKVTKKNSATMCKCPENNLLLHIKKDSISKFKDDLKRKKNLKDWECHPECVEDICIPEQCYVKLKHKRSRHKNNEGKIIIRDQMIRESFIKPIIEVQSKQVGEVGTMPIKMNKQKPRLRAQQTREGANRWLHFSNEEEKILKKAYEVIKKGDHKKDALIPGITVTNKTRAKNLNIGPPRENASRQQVVRIGSSFNFNIEFYKNKGEPNTNISRLNLERLPDITKQSPIKYDHRERKNRKKMKTAHRRHRGSQIQLKYTMKNSKTGGDNSKSCSSFCPRKLMSKRKKPKNNISMNERTHINNKESSSTLNSVTDNAYYTHQKIIKLQKKGQKRFKKKQKLLPYECEPNVCIPGICDPYQCIKLINNRNTKRKEQSVQCKYKCVPRLTSTHYPSLKTKFVNSLTSYKSRNIKNKIKNKKRTIQRTNYSKNGREVVRIGSNISFNLEFYKTKYPHPISSPNIKIVSNGSNVKSNKKTGSQQVQGDKATTHINKKLYKKSGFGTTLNRCFCTLKIQEKKKTKRKKMVTIGTIVNDMNSNAIVTNNKSTKTMKSPPLNYFECEPFVCIPGACDPYECLDRINRSHLKEVGSVTEHPEKVSVSSATYLKKTLRPIQVQSKPQSKDRKTLVKTKNNASEIKVYSPRGNSNQAVKIGSSFSFDIQFFKTNTSVNKNNSKPHIEHKTKVRSRIQKTGRTRKNSRLNVANISTQSKQKDKFTKSSMADHLIKRCFCTLNLQKYRKNQNGKQDILATSMFPRDYTVNRATTTLNPILTCQKTNSTSGLNNIHSKVEDSNPRRLQSTQRKESLIVEKTSQCYSLNHNGDDNWESRISFIEERLMSLKQTEITNLSQYIRQCFYTMNLQSINKNMSGKNPKSTIPTGSGKRLKEFWKGNKSSVRVGSNFSFNIAFSKNLSSSKFSSHTGLNKPIRIKSKEVKTIGTKGYDNTTFERQSQSVANKFVHKGSAVEPLSKRCFCTLKLHKKGRKHMKNYQKHAISTDVPKTANNTISRGQNTDFKPMKIAHSLKPYECEPNICIPGHCDPYQCLEIMKRRNLKHTKESGIVTVHNKNSASSITSDKHSKGTQKTYQSKMKPKANSVKLYRNTFEADVIQPSGPLVRVGSNFSFDIEFFKDKGSPVVTHKTIKGLKDNKHINQRKYLSNLREKGISTPKDSKLRRHKETEIKKTPNRNASTMTLSFLKRCFCTAQLKKDSSPTFFSKCFCFMKSIKHSTVKNEGIHINKVQHVDKKINTKNINIKRYQLAPYECEPGICIPGECNPYECEKILKRNRMRTKSTLSGTTKMSVSRSVSIDSQKLKTKNAKIQLKNREKYKVNKTRERSLSQSTSKYSDRQVVRIGSNFSFNIEFYKNNPSKHYMKLPLTRHEEVTRKKLKNQQSEVIATRTQRSQSAPISKIDRSTEQKHFLKRCFCTLQLHHQYLHLPEEKNQRKKIKQYTKLRDKSVMTNTPKRYEFIPEDFECPPGICVPNQCDPYECERIIKMRRKQQEYKEFGMSTRSPKKSTVSSTTHSLKKYRQSTQTIGHRKYHKNTNYNAKLKEVSSSQRVKIGSSFQFNIEFFKNKNNQGLQINKQPKPGHIKLKHQTKSKVSNAKTQMQKQVKFAKIGDKKTKSQSTMINVSPKLKRCFCTLFMKSEKNKQKPVKKHKTSNIGTETEKPFVPHTSTLLPYECEPQVCIPGECDPVECLERIMKRNKHFGANINFAPTKSSASTKTPGKAKFKAKKSQFKSVTKSELRTKNKTNLKKQAVKMGSNFNFNIEFYKNNAPHDHATKKHNQIEVHRGLKKSDFKENQLNKSFHNTKSQLQKNTCDVSTCQNLKNIPKESQTKSPTFLKKCFCVLKLHKLRNRRKNAATTFDNERIKQQELPHLPKHNIAIQQKLLPYECEPGVCIPGQCDPYECERRIKARELCNRNKCDKKCYMMQKSQNICTQINNPCMDKCIGIRADNYKRKKNQSSLARSAITKSTLNESRLANNLNKQAVKIGSNFSFNIEFYKKSPPTIAPIKMEHIERKITFDNGHDKNIIPKSAIRRNRGSQGKVITSEDKTLDVQNELNRCFCTLKLQKNKQSSYLKKTHKYPQYPQTFEVRRVSVQPNSKWATKKKQTPVRSVSTRINEKYMKANQNICPCIAVTNTTEMKTILPFAPNKFKDTTSKTFFPVHNELKSGKETKRGFKLNKKKSKRHINYNEDLEPKEGSISNIKGFLCRCAGVFLKKQKGDLINTTNHRRNNNENKKYMYNNDPKRLCENRCYDNLRSSKSDRRPIEHIVNENTKVRKSKSLKLENKKRNHEKRNIKESNKVSSKYAKVPNADNHGITVSVKQNKKTDRVLCSHCNIEIQNNKSSLPPLKVHFDDRISLDETKGIRKVFKAVKKQQNKNVNFKESENCACCNSCGRRFNKEELLKAAGDRLIDESHKNLNKIINPQRIKDLFKYNNNKNIDNILKNCRQPKEESPLFEMQLNSDLYDIINKDEVIDNITKLSKIRVKDKTELTKSHKKSCRCCICLGKRKKMVPKQPMAKKSGAEKKKTKPCTCGSFACSKKSQKMNKDLVKVPIRKKGWKPCVCGSPICNRESATMKSLLSRSEEVTCICQETLEGKKSKIQKKKEKAEAERRANIKKKRTKEDKIRIKLRKQRDKEMERRINKTSSDAFLAAESLIDIGKLGITACTDILRTVARCTSDPKQAYYTLKSMKEDPEVIMSTLKSCYLDSGVAATAKRVRLRCLAMKGVKRIKNKLEENAVTNFILHIADNDPRSRVLKKKKPVPVHLRERLDFGCSLYMGSLRKRPYLSIYDRWPWFYPHFLSLLNVWKQFTDIMLFLLAVVVWSPCILCMEACRAIMCCFFCTG